MAAPWHPPLLQPARKKTGITSRRKLGALVDGAVSTADGFGWIRVLAGSKRAAIQARSAAFFIGTPPPLFWLRLLAGLPGRSAGGRIVRSLLPSLRKRFLYRGPSARPRPLRSGRLPVCPAL